MTEKLFQTFESKLIYIFRINDNEHNGTLKIGEATVKTNIDINKLVPNCEELNKSAQSRIDSYTRTAGVKYQLLYTELAIDNGGHAFRDKAVHEVLKNSGIRNKYFDTNKRQDEWFVTDLGTSKNAIEAVKKGDKVLTQNKITQNKNPIVFRPEQNDAIEKTLKQFNKTNKMLWNAKMRFGKTLSALEVVKKKQFKKTIIITHRPVVEEGWFEDFDKIFYDTKNYIAGSREKTTIEHLEKSKKNYIYFASMQDLRGSETVGGNFDKNNLIFKIDWDFVIVDEAHEGTKTELGENVLQEIIKDYKKENKTKVLELSGTPFNLLSDFDENEIYTWDYVMEQMAKDDWTKNHFLDSNPYEDLPQMNIYTYDLKKIIKGYQDIEDKAFNFKEFFRTWTGDVELDRKRLSSEVKIGDFVHEKEIDMFLNILTKEDEDSNYPFSKIEYRDEFRHTLWIVPGVKEAKALSKRLQKHHVFGNGAFKIVNVAGDGDEEEAPEEALKKVKSAMKLHPEDTYTITISCGRLTTGVTVRPWTAVFMLAGAYSTGASNYLQTIFRVQTPANIGGKMKSNCYVFDFAPDRTLKMLAEAGKLSTKAGTDGGDKVRMGNFLNFCPVIAYDGSQMKKYNVDQMLQQLKRAYAERVIRNGFDDSKIYNDTLLKLDGLELEKFNQLKEIIGASKQTKKINDIDLNTSGLTKEEREEIERIHKKEKSQLTEEEKEKLEELKKIKKQKDTAISILRGISIRIPLMIYGADIPFEEDVTIENFTDIVDDKSWEEFMPKGVTKQLFNDFSRYYDKDIFIEAGRKIRNMVKNSEELSITERVKRITSIFMMFKNPDKETVLTPWRVVNMHMGDCLGGYNFFDDNYQQEIEEPRLILHGEVTQKTLTNDNAKILEINSKTGLYPLYVTYSIYRQRLLNINKKKINEEDIAELLWKTTIANNIYVICKTKMAKRITERTLKGFKNTECNVICYENIIEDMKAQKFKNEILNDKIWGRRGSEKMKFDAVVGNPPYQLEGGSGGNNDAPIYQYFANASLEIMPNYATLIMPARWFAAGRENLLGEFRKNMLSNKSISKMYTYTNSHEIFPNVEIKGGICYYLFDKEHSGQCRYTLIDNSIVESFDRDLDDFDILVREPRLVNIIKKVEKSNHSKGTVDEIVSNDTPFGISSNPKTSKKNKIEMFINSTEKHNTKLYYVEKMKRKIEYIDKNLVNKNMQFINKYKVLIPESGGSGSDPYVLGKPELADRNSVCSQTYLFVPFDTKYQAENFIKYLKTKFFRILVSAIKISQSAPNRVYKFVPMQDFTDESDIDWSKKIEEIDTQLYKKYSLTNEEIEFINTSIKYLL